MKNDKELNEWWSKLSGDRLEMMFPDKLNECKGDFNDFIDDCDEWWGYLNLKTKSELYNHFAN